MTGGLDKLIYIYSVDTSSFYNESEQKIHKRLLKAYRYRDYLKTLKDKNTKHKKYISNRISMLKDNLYQSFSDNSHVRHLRNDALRDNNVISMFDSVLTRTIGLNENALSNDLIVVQSYYFQILEDIIKNGFMHNNEKYIYYTSSAGQIRTKKSVFIKESVWNKYKDTLMCGLSVEDINAKGGVNINKYQAYLALSNSATNEWRNFDIHKSIVVEDLETDVFGEVDFIDRDTFEIERRYMNVPITHTDGCGMILPKKSKKSFMCRLPFLKGLIVPFPFDKFAEECDSYIVKDIYGKEWDIKNDEIEVIFTKSQFKMWKYYSNWQDYQEKFIKHRCQAAKLNEEDISADAYLNYQMLQSLNEMTDDELKKISETTIKDILQVGTEKETMLRLVGAMESNKHKNHFQQALEMYPELLNDAHAKQVVKDKKKSMVKDGRSAKLKINGKYTFIIPDLYAFSENLFLGEKNPKGLLKNKEVYCDLFENKKLDLLRAPHLYREHGVRQNVVDEEKGKWFIANGIYTSVHDLISKMLQFDNDGDKSLVVADETLVNAAERHMEGIVPLYYEMAKAEAQEINPENIYRSLTLAYKANIGIISNDITKIWNSNDVSLDAIKWLAMFNNFVIDFAKTLFLPKYPEYAKNAIHKHTKSKLPYFFVYAKKKKDNQVAKVNNSTVNKLNKIIPNKRINFAKVSGNMDYRMLMKDTDVLLDESVINKYKELDRSKKWKMKEQENPKTHQTLYVYRQIRNELLKINPDAEYVTDVLVKYLHESDNSKFKDTLYWSFGDILIENLKFNLNVAEECCDCGGRFRQIKQRQVRCDACQQERNKVNARLRKRKQRNSI